MIELYWLIVYSGNSVKDSEDNSDIGGGISGGKEHEDRTEPVLVSSFNSYSKLDSILLGTSRPSSYPISYHLLTI